MDLDSFVAVQENMNMGIIQPIAAKWNHMATQILVNIGWSNGLLLILTYNRLGRMTFVWKQFCKIHLAHQSLKLA